MVVAGRADYARLLLKRELEARLEPMVVAGRADYARLLLKRELEARLEAAGHRVSAVEALDRLATCCLLRYEKHDRDAGRAMSSIYSTTRPTADQRTLLEALGLHELIDERRLAARLPMGGA